jgi:signal transduction histidine kinase
MLDPISTPAEAPQILSPQELGLLLSTQAVARETIASTPDSPVLKFLATTKREHLAKMMVERPYKRGAIIFREGEQGDALYIIRSGQVVIVKGDLQNPIILGYRGIGEIVGEMALLEDRPRSATVVATEPLRLLCISRESFLTWLDSDPNLKMSILRALSARLRAADKARSDDLQTARRLTHHISQLETEKRQLLEAQDLRRQTTDFIIHDLRTPLSLFSGAVKMLEMVLPEDVLQANHELLDLANINSERMRRLIDSLLDIANLESGTMPLQPTAVNISELIAGILARMTISPWEDVRLHSTIPHNLPSVHCDEEKIERVLANLLDNAFKYTPSQGIVTTSAQVKDDLLYLSVTNTGLTIPLEDRERIFDRFTRITQTNFRRRGSGLGLAFCRLAVEAHGGRIWVEPGEGGLGNRFTFTLPLSPP